MNVYIGSLHVACKTLVAVIVALVRGSLLRGSPVTLVDLCNRLPSTAKKQLRHGHSGHGISCVRFTFYEEEQLGIQVACSQLLGTYGWSTAPRRWHTSFTVGWWCSGMYTGHWRQVPKLWMGPSYPPNTKSHRLTSRLSLFSWPLCPLLSTIPPLQASSLLLSCFSSLVVRLLHSIVLQLIQLPPTSPPLNRLIPGSTAPLNSLSLGS